MPMAKPSAFRTDVLSAREVARAAGVDVRAVHDLVARGHAHPIDGEFFSFREAVRIGLALRGEVSAPLDLDRPHEPTRPLFAPASRADRRVGLPAAASSLVHASLLAVVVVITSTGVGTSESKPFIDVNETKPLRMVYLAQPGPGGGGGGGGRVEPRPAPKIRRKAPAPRPASAPAPPLRTTPLPSVVPVEKPPEPKPEPIRTEALPPVLAPVASVPADEEDRVGIVAETTANAESHGQGEGGGVGTGKGTGVGEGTGPGLGAGEGGGTGGGPYRPGSGIEPPRLLREVKPDFTEEARQLGIEGDVVMEIVVRRDGTVGELKVLQGLGHGLDQRAVDAVKQWRFSAARRLGQAVDVLVEVAVEFKLR